MLTLKGAVRLSVDGQVRKTAGCFSKLMEENADAFLHHFGAQLAPGSFNVTIANYPNIHQDLDGGKFAPYFVIPWAELKGKYNPPRLGDGQAWSCQLRSEKIPDHHDCWVFRRIHSTVPPGVLEILSTVRLVLEFALEDGDPVEIDLLENGG